MISPQAVANARLAVTTAQTNVNNAQTALNNEQYWQNTSLIQNYYANYVLAKDRLDKAQTAYNNTHAQAYINNSNQAPLIIRSIPPSRLTTPPGITIACIRRRRPRTIWTRPRRPLIWPTPR